MKSMNVLCGQNSDFFENDSHDFDVSIIQNVHSLTTCFWDHFEPKISNQHRSDLQRFVNKMGTSILLHL
jgi:hypothetical protein